MYTTASGDFKVEPMSIVFDRMNKVVRDIVSSLISKSYPFFPTKNVSIYCHRVHCTSRLLSDRKISIIYIIIYLSNVCLPFFFNTWIFDHSFFTLIFWYPNTQICRAEKNSFISSGVTHKCKWAQIIISEFMKEDWDNKDSWDVKLLWNGGLREFQLGLQSVRALKDGRNKLSKRIRCTVGE